MWFNETIASLHAQTLSNVQVVLVDDASPSAYQRFLDPSWLLPSSQSNDRQWQWVIVSHSENQGLACARNTGVLHATAPYILFLDPDDRLDPLALEKLVMYGSRWIGQSVPTYPDALYGFVYPGVVHFGDHQDVVYADYHPQRLLNENYLSSTALISRELYLAVGGNCPRQLIRFYEDYDFWLRLTSLGYHGKLLREPLFFYRRHSSGQSHSLIKGIKEETWKAELRRHNPVAFGDLSRRQFCQLLSSSASNTGDSTTSFPCYFRAKEYSETALKSKLSHSSNVSNRSLCARIHFQRLAIDKLPKRHAYLQENYSNFKRILYMLPWMNMGGADLYDLHVLRALYESHEPKYHITLLVARHIDMHPWEHKFLPFAHEVFHLQRLSNDSITDDMILDHLAESRQIQIAINSRTMAGYRAFSRWHDHPLFHNIKKLDILHLYELNSRKGWEWYSGQATPYLDQRIVVSQNLKDYLIQTVGLGDIELGKPLDLRELSPGYRDRISIIYPPLVLGTSASDNELMTSKHNPTLLFLGRLDEQKQPFLFLDVANALPAHIQVKVLGAGALGQEIWHKVYSDPEYSQLSQRITFKGAISQESVPSHLMESSLSVLLLTSAYEGVPIVILESLGLGVPVITTECGGLGEVIRDPIWNASSTNIEKKLHGKTYAIERFPHASIILVNCHQLLDPLQFEIRRDLILLMKEEVEYVLKDLKENNLSLKSPKDSRKTRWKQAGKFRNKYSDSSFRNKWRFMVQKYI